MNRSAQASLGSVASGAPSVSRVASTIFVVVCLLPWTSFGTNNLDSQPWPLLFGILLIATFSGKLASTRNLKLAIFAIVLGLYVAAINSSSSGFIIIRAFYNYISFFIVLLVFLTILDHFKPPIRIIRFMNYIWIAGALIQIVQPGLIAAIGKARTTAERGLTSLSPEPTFFAIYLIFSSLLLFQLRGFDHRKDLRLHVINLLAVALLARSSMGLLMIVVGFCAYVIYLMTRIKIKKRIIVGLGIIAGLGIVVVFVFRTYFAESRVASLVDALAERGVLGIIQYDASMNVRIEHVVFSIHGAVRNYLLPGGFDSFSETRVAIVDSYGGYFWYGTESDKIMSWSGDWLYSLGIFGLLSLAFIATAAYDRTRESFFFLGLVFVLLFSAIPVAFPLVPMLFATMIHRIRVRS